MRLPITSEGRGVGAERSLDRLSRMDETSHEPVASGAPKIAADSRHAELVEIVKTLEHGVERVEALGLTLAAALLDHAAAETRRHLGD